MKRPLRTALTSITVAVLASSCSHSIPAAKWKRVEAPVIKDQTDDITLEKGTLADGTYWSTIARASGSGDILFRTLKARFGETCNAWAKENGLEDACMDDYNVESYPDAFVSIAADATVSVAQPDGPGTSFSINVDVLEMLMTDGAKDAPKGYSWVPFPFVVTVKNGWVTDARQYWVP